MSYAHSPVTDAGHSPSRRKANSCNGRSYSSLAREWEGKVSALTPFPPWRHFCPSWFSMPMRSSCWCEMFGSGQKRKGWRRSWQAHVMRVNLNADKKESSPVVSLACPAWEEEKTERVKQIHERYRHLYDHSPEFVEYDEPIKRRRQKVHSLELRELLADWPLIRTGWCCESWPQIANDFIAHCMIKLHTFYTAIF